MQPTKLQNDECNRHFELYCSLASSWWLYQYLKFGSSVDMTNVQHWLQYFGWSLLLDSRYSILVSRCFICLCKSFRVSSSLSEEYSRSLSEAIAFFVDFYCVNINSGNPFLQYFRESKSPEHLELRSIFECDTKLP